jgi:hypothetical protein
VEVVTPSGVRGAVSDRDRLPDPGKFDDEDAVGDLRGVVLDETSSVTTVPEPPTAPAQPPVQKPPAGTP